MRKLRGSDETLVVSVSLEESETDEAVTIGVVPSARFHWL